MLKNLSANLGNVGSIPGSERYTGEGNGSPLQYSCLENPMHREPGRLQSMRLQRVGHDLTAKHQQQPHFRALGSRGSCLTTRSLILLICKANIIKATFKVWERPGKAAQLGSGPETAGLKSHGRNLRSASWHEEFSTPR